MKPTPKHITTASKLPLFKLFLLVLIGSLGLVTKVLLESIVLVLAGICEVIKMLLMSFRYRFLDRLPDFNKLKDVSSVMFKRISNGNKR